MTDNNERRMCTRTHFLTGVTLLPDGGAPVAAELVNISISGMLVQTAEQIPLGSACKIEIVVAGHHSRLLLEDIEGVVVRRKGDEVGINFTSRMEWFVLFNIYTHYCRQGKDLFGEAHSPVYHA